MKTPPPAPEPLNPKSPPYETQSRRWPDGSALIVTPKGRDTTGSAGRVLGNGMYANFVAGKPNQLVGQVVRAVTIKAQATIPSLEWAAGYPYASVHAEYLLVVRG